MAGPLTPAPIIVRTYRARTPEQAGALYEADAVGAAAMGYYPVSQSWASGSWSPLSVAVGIVLSIFVIGLFVLAYMLLVPPDGALTVTYARDRHPLRQVLGVVPGVEFLLHARRRLGNGEEQAATAHTERYSSRSRGSASSSARVPERTSVPFSIT